MNDRCWEHCTEIQQRFQLASFVAQNQDPLSPAANDIYAVTAEGVRQELGHCEAGPQPDGIVKKNGLLHKLGNMARVAFGKAPKPPREVQVYACGVAALQAMTTAEAISTIPAVE